MIEQADIDAFVERHRRERIANGQPENITSEAPYLVLLDVMREKGLMS